MSHRHQDRGLWGTKFIMAVLAMAICGLGYAATAWYPALNGSYPVLVGAINGVAALYMTGNAASQYVAAKHGPKEAPVEPPPQAK